MKVKVAGGKILMLGRQVVTNLSCCCGGFTPDCTCPRDIYEITGFTLEVTPTFTPCDICTDACSPLTCTGTETWTRISYLDSFNAPHQFKLWVDADCNIQYSDNRDTTPAAECLVFGPHYGDFGLDNLHGSTSLTLFTFSNTQFGLGFTTEGDSNCFFDVCAPTFGTTIDLGHCDVTPIIGAYSTSDTVIDANGSTMAVEGSVTIF